MKEQVNISRKAAEPPRRRKVTKSPTNSLRLCVFAREKIHGDKKEDIFMNEDTREILAEPQSRQGGER